jgi:hypothetical protein
MVAQHDIAQSDEIGVAEQRCHVDQRAGRGGDAQPPDHTTFRRSEITVVRGDVAATRARHMAGSGDVDV